MLLSAWVATVATLQPPCAPFFQSPVGVQRRHAAGSVVFKKLKSHFLWLKTERLCCNGENHVFPVLLNESFVSILSFQVELSSCRCLDVQCSPGGSVDSGQLNRNLSIFFGLYHELVIRKCGGFLFWRQSRVFAEAGKSFLNEVTSRRQQRKQLLRCRQVFQRRESTLLFCSWTTLN